MANNPQFSGMQPLQPPLVGPMDPPRNLFPAPPMPVQFRPVVPVQPQQFIPASSPHFQPAGRGVTVMNAGLPPQPPQPQFPHSMQQLPAINNQPSHAPPPPPQAIPLTNAQPNRHVMSGSPLPPHSVQTSNYMPGLGGLGMPLSSSYTFAPSSYGQPPITFNAVSQYQPIPQMHAPSIPSGGQPALSSMNQNTAPVIPIQHSGEHSSIATANVPTSSIQPRPTEEALTEWKEHTSANGRRFYYNKRTKQSSWEKPFELMTSIEHPSCERTNARHVRSGHSRLWFLGQYVLELAFAEYFLQRYPRESPAPLRERVYGLIGKRNLPKWIKSCQFAQLDFSL